MCQENVPRAGAHSSSTGSPVPSLTDRVSHLVEKSDLEQEHRGQLPVSMSPVARPWSALQNHLCRLLSLSCQHEGKSGNHRAERNTQLLSVVNIITAFTLCC